MDGRTRRRLETRRQILAAGADLLHEGAENITVAALIERAQVSHGSFYNHFSSLTEFVDQLVHHGADRLLNDLLGDLAEDDVSDVRVAMAYVMSRMVAAVRSDPRIGALTASAPPGYGDRDQAAVEARVAMIASAITAGVLPEQDPRLLEIASRRLLHGAVCRYHEHGFTDTAEVDTATSVLRLAGVPERDIGPVIARVEALSQVSPGVRSTRS